MSNFNQNPSVKVGDTIKIVKMAGDDVNDPQALGYRGKQGTVEYIDSLGQLHGTWGGLAVIPEADEFVLLDSAGSDGIDNPYIG